MIIDDFLKPNFTKFTKIVLILTCRVTTLFGFKYGAYRSGNVSEVKAKFVENGNEC